MQKINLSLNEQLKQAVKNLLKAGIAVKVWTDEDVGYILIDVNSIADILEKRLTYPNKKVYFKENYIIIEVWRE